MELNRLPRIYLCPNGEPIADAPFEIQFSDDGSAVMRLHDSQLTLSDRDLRWLARSLLEQGVKPWN